MTRAATDGFSYVGTLEDPMMRKQADSLAQIVIARSERSAGNIQAAIEAFTRALDLCFSVGYPGLVLVERGDMYLALERFDKALEDFEKAIIINPHPTYLQRKLDILLRSGDHSGANAVRELMNRIPDESK
ncbi:MAG: tetratricopeptide repeat protein [Proteobacteria bacterium]|nr:tetratricopeptide repeat protein [Pseudomonadota bacterium]